MRASQGTADRVAVAAVTAEALAGRGGMPGLLWSHVWLTEALGSPDEVSFADTTPLTEMSCGYDSRRARRKLRFRDALIPGDRAA